MRNFIEVYDKDEKTKVLISLRAINTVSVDADNYTFIELKRDNDGNSYGVKTEESYQTVCNKIYYAQVAK